MKLFSKELSSERPHIGQSSLFKNSLLNLSGMVLPTIVAAVAIPLCVRFYSPDNFGLLSLGWTFIVAFAYLDLGLGVSTTKYAAEVLQQQEESLVPAIVWSSLGLQFIAGTFFAAVIFVSAPFIEEHVIAAPVSLQNEAIDVVRYAGLSIPFITMSAALRGVLEASNRFDLTNAIKIPSSSLLFLIPGLGAVVGLSVSTVVLLLLFSRVGTAMALFYLTARLYPSVLHGLFFDPKRAKQLLKFGGWVGVSTLLSPMIHQGEKLLIPSMLSVGALSFYSPPQELVARIAVIPFSLAIAMLPKFSYLGKENTVELREQVLIKPAKYLFLIMTPLAAFLIFFSSEILLVWLGPAFVITGTDVLALLACAYFFNAFAYVAFSAIQGLGYPESKAIVDLILAPSFLLFCWFTLSAFGLVGAAAAKLVVLFLDAACLLLILKNILKIPARELFPSQLRSVGLVSVLILFGGMLVHLLGVSFIIRLILYGVAIMVLWRVFVSVGSTKEELQSIRQTLFTSRPFAQGQQLTVHEEA